MNAQIRRTTSSAMTDTADTPLTAETIAAAINDLMFDTRVEEALTAMLLETADRPYAVTWGYSSERDRFTLTATKDGISVPATIEAETLGDGGWEGVVSGFDTEFVDQAASSK